MYTSMNTSSSPQSIRLNAVQQVRSTASLNAVVPKTHHLAVTRPSARLALTRTDKKHTDGDCITRTVYETPEGKMYVKRRVNNSRRYQYVHVRYLNAEPNTHRKCMAYRGKSTPKPKNA